MDELSEAVAANPGLDGRGSVEEDVEGTPAEALDGIDDAERQAHGKVFLREYEAQEAAGEPRSGVDEARHVVVAADDAIQGHDVDGIQGGCQLDDVALKVTDPVGVPPDEGLVAGRLQVGRGRVDVDAVGGAGGEKAVLDGAYAPADVEEGRVGHPGSAKSSHESSGGSRGAPAAVASELTSRQAAVEFLDDPLALGAGHDHLWEGEEADVTKLHGGST